MGDSDGEEAPILEGTRKEQEELQAEVQEMREALLLQLDDPAYENIDCGQLEDLEAEIDVHLNQGRRHKVRLSKEEATPDVKAADERSWKAFQQLVQTCKSSCKRLKAIRQVYGKIQTADRILTQLKDKRLENPNKDYTTPVKRVSDRVQDVLEILDNSSISPDHKLRVRAMELEISLEDMEIVDLILTPDTKDFSKDKGKTTYKRAPLAIPTFSGELKDWLPFWRGFEESVDSAEDLSDAAKMMYFKSAMKDKSLYRRLNRPIKGETYYQDMVKEFKAMFTKPIQMHQIHVKSLMNMEPVKLTKESINSFAETICEALDGIRELGQTDFTYIVTSMVMSYLPQKLKQSWDEKLEGLTQVPAAEELVKFLRAKADNPSYVDKPSSTRIKPSKPFKQKGSVNVATPHPKTPAQPVQQSQPPPYAAPQPAPVQSSTPPPQHRSRQAPSTCKYVLSVMRTTTLMLVLSSSLTA